MVLLHSLLVIPLLAAFGNFYSFDRDAIGSSKDLFSLLLQLVHLQLLFKEVLVVKAVLVRVCSHCIGVSDS